MQVSRAMDQRPVLPDWQTWFQQGTAEGTIKTEAGTFWRLQINFLEGPSLRGISLSKY